MANLDNFRGDGNPSIPQYVSTWTETASATGADTCTASHAAEAGKTHYLCGLIASCDMGHAQPPETVEVQVRDGPLFGGTDIIEFRFTSGSQKLDTTTNETYASPTGSPLVINIAQPIMITEGNLVNCSVDPQDTTDAVESNVTIWGFTNETRIE